MQNCVNGNTAQNFSYVKPQISDISCFVQTIGEIVSTKIMDSQATNHQASNKYSYVILWPLLELDRTDCWSLGVCLARDRQPSTNSSQGTSDYSLLGLCHAQVTSTLAGQQSIWINNALTNLHQPDWNTPRDAKRIIHIFILATSNRANSLSFLFHASVQPLHIFVHLPFSLSQIHKFVSS